MDDVKQMDNNQLLAQATETMAEWDDIEAHLGTQNKASIGLFHSRSDDLRVLLEAAVGRLELAGPAPEDGPSLAKEQLAEVGVCLRLPGGEVPSDVVLDADILIDIDEMGRAQMVKNRWGAHMQVPVYGSPSSIGDVRFMDFARIAGELDEAIGGLRGKADGATIQTLLVKAQELYAVVLNRPGEVSDDKREELSEQARAQAEEERRVIQEVRDAAPEVEDASEADREQIREAIAVAMEDTEEVASFPESTGKRYEWHAVATGSHGTVEAKAFSHESGPDPDESKRLFEEMWNAYELIYNDAPNSISVNVEDLG